MPFTNCPISIRIAETGQVVRCTRPADHDGAHLQLPNDASVSANAAAVDNEVAGQQQIPGLDLNTALAQLPTIIGLAEKYLGTQTPKS